MKKLITVITVVLNLVIVGTVASLFSNSVIEAHAASRQINEAKIEAERLLRVAANLAILTELRAQTIVENTFTPEDMECLQKNIFFEARNQSISGQVAVAWVTLNRMENSKFPDNICAVVYQGQRDANGNMIRNKCQFSWYCDGKSDRILNNAVAQRAWEDARIIAEVVVLDWARGNISPIENATYYHANYVHPRWARSFTEVATIDDHIFYTAEN